MYGFSREQTGPNSLVRSNQLKNCAYARFACRADLDDPHVCLQLRLAVSSQCAISMWSLQPGLSFAPKYGLWRARLEKGGWRFASMLVSPRRGGRDPATWVHWKQLNFKGGLESPGASADCAMHAASMHDALGSCWAPS